MTVPAASPAADQIGPRSRLVPGVPPGAIETGAAVGAAGLALTSTGSMVVAAVFLACACRSRWSLLALVGATAAVAVRFSTVTFDDVAGIQSVLGAAGAIGPAVAAASAWTAAAAVLLALRVPPGGTNLHRCAVALAGGATAAAIAVGPGPGGDLGQRVAATAAATVLGFAVTTVDRRPGIARLRAAVAVGAGVAAVVLAGWPA